MASKSTAIVAGYMAEDVYASAKSPNVLIFKIVVQKYNRHSKTWRDVTVPVAWEKPSEAQFKMETYKKDAPVEAECEIDVTDKGFVLLFARYKPLYADYRPYRPEGAPAQSSAGAAVPEAEDDIPF